MTFKTWYDNNYSKLLTLMFSVLMASMFMSPIFGVYGEKYGYGIFILGLFNIFASAIILCVMLAFSPPPPENKVKYGCSYTCYNCKSKNLTPTKSGDLVCKNCGKINLR